MNILISAANSEISDSLCRIHKEAYPNDKVVGIAPDGLWPGSAVFDRVYEIGTVENPQYSTILLDVLGEEDIEIFVPVSEQELRFYLQKKILIPRPIKVLSNPPSVLSVCLNKMNTYEWLDEMQMECPKTTYLHQVEPSHLPIFIKPSESAGSKNSYAVHTWHHYQGLLKEFQYSGIPLKNMIAQTYLVGNEQEYTCAISKIAEKSNFLILKRKLVGGITGKATVCSNTQILELLKRISDNFQGNFFINVQLRLVDDKPIVFEINSRFSSTVMLRHLIGFQDYLWHIQNLKNGSVPGDPKIEDKLMFRTFREVIV